MKPTRQFRHSNLRTITNQNSACSTTLVPICGLEHVPFVTSGSLLDAKNPGGHCDPNPSASHPSRVNSNNRYIQVAVNHGNIYTCADPVVAQRYELTCYFRVIHEPLYTTMSQVDWKSTWSSV